MFFCCSYGWRAGGDCAKGGGGAGGWAAGDPWQPREAPPREQWGAGGRVGAGRGCGEPQGAHHGSAGGGYGHFHEVPVSAIKSTIFPATQWIKIKAA